MFGFDPAQLGDERIRPLSRLEYDRLVALGAFADERVELLRGVLIAMSPMGTKHAHVIRRLTRLLLGKLGARADVGTQTPLATSDDSEPEPDLSVVPTGDYLDDHPTRAYLVIEIAESSLTKDRSIKAPLYAEAGVPEYWIVNLIDDCVEVHSRPQAGRYQDLVVRRRGESIRLVAHADVTCAVDEILPPRTT